jgi:hypothetical protein
MTITKTKLIVRCEDRTVFEVDQKTLDPKGCSVYDAYCFSDTEKDVMYISYADWVQKRNERWYTEMYDYF